MAETIWKYDIPIDDGFMLKLPMGARILSVQTQGRMNDPKLWAIVDPSAREEVRHFRIVGTGHPIPEMSLTFVATFQMLGGGLVWHLFEEK